MVDKVLLFCRLTPPSTVLLNVLFCLFVFSVLATATFFFAPHTHSTQVTGKSLNYRYTIRTVNIVYGNHWQQASMCTTFEFFLEMEPLWNMCASTHPCPARPSIPFMYILWHHNGSRGFIPVTIMICYHNGCICSYNITFLSYRLNLIDFDPASHLKNSTPLVVGTATQQSAWWSATTRRPVNGRL